MVKAVRQISFDRLTPEQLYQRHRLAIYLRFGLINTAKNLRMKTALADMARVKNTTIYMVRRTLNSAR